jgi:hypothetical protein
MTDMPTIVNHSRHSLPGPRFGLPAGFVPLRMCVEAEKLHIEVTCPFAVVGRHTDADVRFAFPEISRRHCRVAFENGQWRIHDLASMNGIFVNGLRVLDTALYAGDLVRLGSVNLLVTSATPLRLLKRDDEKHDKLRQIVDVLPEVDR